MTRSVLIGAACFALGGTAVAGAQTSHVFGDGGQHYAFDAMCHRQTFVPPGISNHEAINIAGQQIRCLVRRPDPFAQCVRRLGVPPVVAEKSDHGPGKPGDEIGAARLAGYVASVYACSRAHL